MPLTVVKTYRDTITSETKMTEEIRIKKRDGSLEPFNIEKIHKVVQWACNGLTGVSPSQIELKSKLYFYDGMESQAIHKTLTKTAADLITPEDSNYQYVASKLVNFNLRKEVYGQPEPWHLRKIVERNITLGWYTEELKEWYSDEELNYLNKIIKHDRDYDISYAGMGQWLGKYLAQDRVKEEHFETPQVAYVLIAATLFHDYPASTRMKFVKEYYDALSKFKISVPTPVLAGARTREKQFSSCVLIESADSLDSINATSSAIVNYVSQKAGIGINIGRIRPVGTKVRGGDVEHTGVIPFLKYFQAALKSCSQGGVRGGSATVYYPYFHGEVENLLVAKNNKGTEESRVRHVDYGIQFNKLIYERALAGQDVTLFNSSEVPQLWDTFYSGDNDAFAKLYSELEKSPKVAYKRKVNAYELMSQFLDERQNTGRIYLQNIDHCNTHSSFDQTKHPVTMSNLCAEITLPTKPFESLHDESGRIALCTLSAINWGVINKPEDFEKPCELAVRSLDALLSYQNYPAIQAELSTREFRTLGIGINNLAYFLAKNGTGYTQESALELVDEYMEAMSFYIIKASVQLAKEKGACELSHETKYGQGLFPWETAHKNVNDLVPLNLRMDWESLRADMKEHGVRNAAMMACMPSESSSQLINATNGVEPPRGFVSEKSSKHGVFKQVVPEYSKYKNKYELLWDQESPRGYLSIMAVLQRYMDQTISANTSYNPLHFKTLDANGGEMKSKIPLTTLIEDLYFTYSHGIKTLYYANTYDANEGDGTEKKDTVEEPLPVEIIDDEDCEGCVL